MTVIETLNLVDALLLAARSTVTSEQYGRFKGEAERIVRQSLKETVNERCEPRSGVTDFITFREADEMGLALVDRMVDLIQDPTLLRQIMQKAVAIVSDPSSIERPGHLLTE